LLVIFEILNPARLLTEFLKDWIFFLSTFFNRRRKWGRVCGNSHSGNPMRFSQRDLQPCPQLARKGARFCACSYVSDYVTCSYCERVDRMTTPSSMVMPAQCCMAKATTDGLTSRWRWSSAPTEKSV